MSISANLIDEYQTSLMSNDVVRYWCSVLPQNAQTETIDMTKLQQVIRKAVQDVQALSAFKSDVHSARRAIMGWLNKVFFSHLESPFHEIWWWEMHTRIQKLLVISMVLEGDNLRSFGAKPETSDIPQALVHIMRTIKSHQKKAFPKLQKEYQICVESLNTEDSDYINLYLS
jgi:hypothetical protein